jgi:hypothetical protein
VNSISQNDLGPILILCYTNHALDQFLCHLLDIGIESIARIGSRSKEPRMEGYDIKSIRSELTQVEKKMVWNWNTEIDKLK